MHLRALLFVPVVSLAGAAACGPSVSDVCSEFAQVWCDRHYTCATGTDLQTLQSKYGADVATCTKNFAQLEGCTSTNQSPCPVGTSYDTGRAQQCTTDYQGISCADVVASKDPSNCSLQTYICH